MISISCDCSPGQAPIHHETKNNAGEKHIVCSNCGKWKEYNWGDEDE